jgi:hypothetical protein
LNKILFLLLSFSILLSARENPFFAAQGEQDIPITSNKEKNYAPLQRATISLPSTARVIEGVTIKYKNLDGSQDTKSITLENAVDWHLPIFISQSYTQENVQMPKSKTPIAQAYTKIASLKFISLYENENNLKILTKDKMLRNFLLVKPHRIVCDFKRDIDIRSYIKLAPKSSKFKKVSFGTHSGYYRVVVELDGYYSYDIKKIKDGYVVHLH